MAMALAPFLNSAPVGGDQSGWLLHIATPQYAMAQSGSSSIIFAKTFSASSYSNEWSSAIARLKSVFTLPGQDVKNSTVPNCLFGKPHKAMCPRLRFIAFIASFEGALFFLLQDSRIIKHRLR